MTQLGAFMKPVAKRSIITSNTTGRRYFLVRSSSRPGGRRYYLCSKPDCETRVAREADLFCRSHSEAKGTDIENNNENETDVSTRFDDVDESILNDHSEIVEEDLSLKEQQDEPNTESQENGHEIENNDSITENDLNNVTENGNSTESLSPRQRTKANRQIEVDEVTGVRSFRDSSGRRRHLCTNPTCTNMLKRQTDVFCRTHTISSENGNGDSNSNSTREEKDRKKKKRYSAPVSSNQTEESPTILNNTITTSTIQNGTNGNHSEEYESPEKVPERTGTKRSFRDASGRVRFLCSIPTCNSRVHRQAETFCRRHQREFESKKVESISEFIAANVSLNQEKDENGLEKTDVNHNNTDTPSRQPLTEPSTKRRKHEPQSSIAKPLNFSSIPANQIVLSTTTLVDDQWNNIIAFLRQYSQIQLSTNLVVNDSTTHLLVDDSEKSLHCTITKKIVQAAVRRRIFIISARWIRDCLQANQFLDEHPYEILSDSHTTLRLSVQNFQNNNQYLFTSKYAFAIECRQCQGSINRNELVELIELTGALVYDHDQIIDMLIVLCDTNEKNLPKIKEKYLQSNVLNIKYVTSDFLLKSIIKFEIQDIDKYSL
ncbi:hypothetical protein I4U23_007063 [Adineta vaga]|nr:hypothetical protein I4U23_007063 [Adineta vaga]